jgi:hypothetical protein
MTLAEVERALADGHLWAYMRHGRYWQLRRNGMTKRWKTRPSDYEIPVKAGMAACHRLDHNTRIATIDESDWRSANFVVTPDNPRIWGGKAK